MARQAARGISTCGSLGGGGAFENYEAFGTVDAVATTCAATAESTRAAWTITGFGGAVCAAAVAGPVWVDRTHGGGCEEKG